MAGWGFAVKTNLVWIKPSIGLGYLLRNRHELLWIATRGNPPPLARGEQPDSVLEALRGEHSEKPAAVYEMIARLYPTLPKIELFARGAARDGRRGGTRRRIQRDRLRWLCRTYPPGYFDHNADCEALIAAVLGAHLVLTGPRQKGQEFCFAIAERFPSH